MKRARVIKLLNYEYWPMWAFYLPLLPYILIRGIVKGHLFYFTNANPGMDLFGGMFSDSKNEIDALFPESYRPFSIVVSPFADKDGIEASLRKMNLKYPVILKPDSGERGEGVLKINDEETLIKSLGDINRPFLIQEYITLPEEFAVFIAFIPDIKVYQVVSITGKKYFEVTGDGKSSIQELILTRERGIVFFERIKKRSEYPMDYVPAEGQKCCLHTLGNHCNGTEFINRNDLKSIELDNSFNNFMRTVNGIKYGRFDLKVLNSGDLISFRNLKIIEFNGVAAEPTHIYDSRLGYFNALKAFISHWGLLNDISVFNKKLGVSPADFKKVINKIRERYK